MPVSERELRKNYIGILSDESEEQHAIAALAESDRVIKHYLLGLMASVLNRDGMR